MVFIESNRAAYIPQQNQQNKSHTDLVGYFMEREPGELAQLLTALEAPQRRAEKRQFLAYVRMVIDDVEAIQVRPDALGNNVYVKRGNREQPLYRSGSGLTQILYVCGRVLQSVKGGVSSGGIVIVDEPEDGLHPDYHARLIKLFGRLYADYGIQCIMATHSPYLLGEVVRGQVASRLYHVRLIDDSTRVDLVDPDGLDAVYEGIGLHLPSLLNSTAAIFVEGATEQKLLAKLLEKVSPHISNERIVIIPLGGDLVRHISPKDLARLHPRVFVWLDSELKAPGNRLVGSRRKFSEYHGSPRLQVYVDVRYRAVENMYPSRALMQAVRAEGDVPVLPYASFQSLSAALRTLGATRKSLLVRTHKPDLAEAVADAMTADEAVQFPAMVAILKWLNESRTGL